MTGVAAPLLVGGIGIGIVLCDHRRSRFRGAAARFELAAALHKGVTIATGLCQRKWHPDTG
jgi:hypothetical protein